MPARLSGFHPQDEPVFDPRKLLTRSVLGEILRVSREQCVRIGGNEIHFAANLFRLSRRESAESKVRMQTARDALKQLLIRLPRAGVDQLFIRAEAYGTAFTLDVAGQEYLITAKHLIQPGGDRQPLQVQHNSQWNNYTATVVGRARGEIDIAVLKLDVRFTPNSAARSASISRCPGT